MIGTPSPEHGKDLLDEKVESGTQNAKVSEARANEFSDYSIVRPFRKAAPEVTKDLYRGHGAMAPYVERFFGRD